MALYLGVDIHERQQTVSYLDTEDGTTWQQELSHAGDEGFKSAWQALRHLSAFGIITLILPVRTGCSVPPAFVEK